MSTLAAPLRFFAFAAADPSAAFLPVFEANAAWKGYRLPDDFAASAAPLP